MNTELRPEETITLNGGKARIEIDSHFEVLLADSTKSKDGFTFMFKGEPKEIPTQVFRFTAQSDTEAMTYLYTGRVYLLTRLEDGSEVYRRPYDSWR